MKTAKIESFFASAKSLVISFIRNIFRGKNKIKVSNGTISKSTNSTANFVILRKFKIKTRLIASFVLLIITALLITGIFSYSSSTNTIDEKVKSYSLQVMNQTSVVLDNQTKRLEKYYQDFNLDTAFTTALTQYEIGDEDQKLDISTELKNYLSNNFISSGNEIEYCAVLYGENFTEVSAYNGSNTKLDFEKIAKKDLTDIEWSDIEIIQEAKTGHLFGMQKNINDVGDVIAKMVLIPQENFFLNAFKNLDIGKDPDSEKAFPIFVVDSDGKIISSRDTEEYQIGKSNDVSKAIASAIKSNMTGKTKIAASNIKLEVSGADSLVTYSQIGNKNWFVVSSVPYSYLNSAASTLGRNIIIIGLLCIVFALVLCLMIAKSVSSPLDKLILTMKRAKEGDLTSQIQDSQNDEISEVCNNFNDMLSNINSLVSQVRNSSQRVLGAANKISEASHSTYNASEQVALTVEQIAKGASEQATEINESVANMDKLSEGITFVGDDVSHVIDIANKISNLNANADQTINELNIKSGQVSDTTNKVSTNINDLNDSMKEIQKILKIMISISEQTNLLSLNASIEAARAGEAGKGFAVVASEVKKLADKSKEFSSNINGIIAAIGQKTNDTVNEVLKSNVVVNEQISAVKNTEELFKTVFSAMGDVIANIARTEKSVGNIMKSKEKVLESMENISAVAEESAATTQEISASTQEQIASCEDLSYHAKELKDLSEALNNELDKFKI